MIDKKGVGLASIQIGVPLEFNINCTNRRW